METGEVQNLTKDAYADNNPQVSPDGKLVVYERRISGHDKLYAFPLADPARKTQLTFGPFDDTAPFFSTDGTKVYYSSDEDDDIPNLRSLDLRTGAIHQYTDVFGGTMAPAPLQDAARRPPRLHHLLQGRVQAAHARHGRADEGGRPGGAGGRRGPRRLPARRAARGGAGEQAPQADLRGALSRGPAADQRRASPRAATSSAAPRWRSPTCSATSSSPSRSCRCPRTASTTAATSTSRAASTTGCNFFDQTYFFYPYNYVLLRLLRPGPARPGDRDAALHRRAGLRRVPARHLPPARVRGRRGQGRRAVRRPAKSRR